MTRAFGTPLTRVFGTPKSSFAGSVLKRNSRKSQKLILSLLQKNIILLPKAAAALVGESSLHNPEMPFGKQCKQRERERLATQSLLEGILL